MGREGKTHLLTNSSRSSVVTTLHDSLLRRVQVPDLLSAFTLCSFKQCIHLLAGLGLSLVPREVSH